MAQSKSIIWHMSLSAVYTECPYCHAQNSDDPRTGECKSCHNVMSYAYPKVYKSKDLVEVEKLGLHGPVHKNEKGQWEEWKDPYQIGGNYGSTSK